jgi:trehalose 6-phosphate phosphatase
VTTRTLADEAYGLSQRASEVALCLDFDGTLAPIVENPEEARPLTGVLDVLATLAKRFAAVAVVSGRPAAYLAEHALAPGVRYLGLYGLQEIYDDRIWVDERLRAGQPAVVAAAGDLRNAPAVTASGAFLEDKTYAVAVHTRRVPEPERWAAALDAAVRDIAARRGLEVIAGRLVWELRPAVKGDKGDAVRRVVADSNARAVVVIGDDLGDLPAFAAARALVLDGHGGLRIAVRSAEAPAQLLREADIVVDGPLGVRDFLELLVADSY